MSAGVRREGTASLLREGETCWKVARAGRLSEAVELPTHLGVHLILEDEPVD